MHEYAKQKHTNDSKLKISDRQSIPMNTTTTNNNETTTSVHDYDKNTNTERMESQDVSILSYTGHKSTQGVTNCTTSRLY